MQVTVWKNWMIEQAIRTAKLRLCCLDGSGGIHADDALRIVIEELVEFHVLESGMLTHIHDDEEEQQTTVEGLKE